MCTFVNLLIDVVCFSASIYFLQLVLHGLLGRGTGFATGLAIESWHWKFLSRPIHERQCWVKGHFHLTSDHTDRLNTHHDILWFDNEI